VIFEWDEDKRRANWRKHGLDFSDSAVVLGGPLILMVDGRFDYGEVRVRAYGLLHRRVVQVVYTERSGTIRVISMRKANRYEETYYFESIKNRLEAHRCDA
jgi:uncharacterized DUF497 family protein